MAFLIPSADGTAKIQLPDGSLVDVEHLFPGFASYMDAPHAGPMAQPALPQVPIAPPPVDDALAGAPPSMQLGPPSTPAGAVPGPIPDAAMVAPQAAPAPQGAPLPDSGSISEGSQRVVTAGGGEPTEGAPGMPGLSGNFAHDLGTSGHLALKGAEAIAGAEEASANAEADALGQKAAFNLQALDKQRDTAERAHMQAEADLAQLRTDVEEIKNTVIHGDPSTGAVIGSLISGVIQGVLNPRGPNSAAENLQRIIAKDIEVQRANLQTKTGAVQSGMQLAQARRYSTMDDLENMNKIRIAHLENFKTELDAKIAGTKSLAARAKLAETRGVIFEKLRDAYYDHELLWDQRKLGWATLDETKRHNAADEGGKAGMDVAERLIFDPLTGEAAGVAGTGKGEELAKIRTDVAAAGSVVKQVTDLIHEEHSAKAVYSGPGSQFLDEPETRARRARAKALMFDLVRYMSGLSYTDKQLVEMKIVSPDIESLMTSNPEQAWKVLLKTQTHRLQTRTNSVGGQDPRTGKAIDWYERFGVDMTESAPPMKPMSRTQEGVERDRMNQAMNEAGVIDQGKKKRGAGYSEDAAGRDDALRLEGELRNRLLGGGGYEANPAREDDIRRKLEHYRALGLWEPQTGTGGEVKY